MPKRIYTVVQFKTPTYNRSAIILSEIWIFKSVTDGRTDRKRCIWAHRAICTSGLKNATWYWKCGPFRSDIKIHGKFAIFTRLTIGGGWVKRTILLLRIVFSYLQPSPDRQTARHIMQRYAWATKWFIQVGLKTPDFSLKDINVVGVSGLRCICLKQGLFTQMNLSSLWGKWVQSGKAPILDVFKKSAGHQGIARCQN